MGLRLRLKPFERIVINGCVVTNGDRRNTITVSSFGQVMKSKDIMQPEQATSPLKRLYFIIQSLLISRDDANGAKRHMSAANAQAAKIIGTETAEEVRRTLFRVMDFVHTGDYYKGLAELRPLIKFEGKPAGGSLVPAEDPAFLMKLTANDGPPSDPPAAA